MLTSEWKHYCATERDRLGQAGLARLIERAPVIEVPQSGAVIFPHTKLTESGELSAAAALAVVRSGCERVLALGVLHTGRSVDSNLFQCAHDGDSLAVLRVRRIHGPGIPGDEGFWGDEFSLDSFVELLAIAAQLHRRKAPEVIARYPFLTGDKPSTMPGLDELRRLLREGCVLIATTDPIHHGVGYDTPPNQWRNRDDLQTIEFARSRIGGQLAALSVRDYAGFSQRIKVDSSDFRDNGPVLRELLDLEDPNYHIFDLRLVDYTDTHRSAPPTWAAGALATFQRS